MDDINSLVSDRNKIEMVREKEQHKQLEVLLSSAELERNELLARIGRISGEKEVVNVCTNGQRMSYNCTSVNIEHILNEIRANKEEIERQEQVIDQTKAQLLHNDDDVYAMEHQLGHLTEERDQLHH
jgi:hypothetical protein